MAKVRGRQGEGKRRGRDNLSNAFLLLFSLPFSPLFSPLLPSLYMCHADSSLYPLFAVCVSVYLFASDPVSASGKWISSTIRTACAFTDPAAASVSVTLCSRGGVGGGDCKQAERNLI